MFKSEKHFLMKPLYLLLFLPIFSLAQSFYEKDIIAHPDSSNDAWFGTDIAMTDEWMVLGSYGPDSAFGMPAPNIGAAYIYKKSTTNCWIFHQKLVSPTALAFPNTYFGYSIDMDDSTMVFGAQGENRAHTFTYNSNSDQWEFEQTIMGAMHGNAQFFGQGVTIYGDKLIVTDNRDDSRNPGNSSWDNGAAYAFERIGGVWTFQELLVPSELGDDDNLGMFMALDMVGDYLAVGSWGIDSAGSNAGGVFVWKHNGSNWIQDTILFASDPGVNDYFGGGLDMDGNRMVIQAPGHGTNRGAAYVYENIADTWTFQQQLIAPDAADNSEFSWETKIKGDTIIAGARYDDENGNNSGAVYVFDYDGTNWSFQQKFLASDGSGGDELGYGIGYNGEFIAAGTPRNDSPANNAGQVYIYTTPLIDISNPTNVCLNDDTVNLNVAIPLGGSYSGNGVLGNSSFLAQNANVGIHDIYYTYTDPEGCVNVDSTDIEVYNIPTFTLGNDTSFCDGNSMVLARPNIPFDSSLWSNTDTSQSITISNSGEYWLQLTDSNNCSFRDTLELTINDLPSFTLGNDTNICNGSDLILVRPNMAYDSSLWSNTDTSQSITVSNTGEYWLQVIDSNNCSFRDTMELFIDPLPVFSLINDTSICNGDNLEIGTNVGSSWNWSNGQNSDSITVSSAGTYTLNVTDTNNCSFIDSMTLSFHADPDVDLGANQNICLFDSITLDAGDFVHYNWNDGSDTRTMTALDSGIFWVTVQDTNQCIETDSISIMIYEYHGNQLSDDTTACDGEIVSLALPNIFSYSWETGSISNSIDVTTDGTYTVQITDTFNCIFSDSIQVSFYSLPEVSLGPDTGICSMYETMLLNANTTGNIDTYTWNGVETFSNQIEIDSIGTVVLVVTSSENCSASDTIIIENACEGFEIDFPNVITTNNDGFNEFFEPINYDVELERLLAAYHFTKFEVYNRWGNLVYESEGEIPEWDGRNMNGSALLDGTYFWIVYYQLDGSENIQNGFVEVMRQ